MSRDTANPRKRASSECTEEISDEEIEKHVDRNHGNHPGWRIHFLEVILLFYFMGFAMDINLGIQFVYSRVLESVLEELNVTLSANSTDMSPCAGHFSFNDTSTDHFSSNNTDALVIFISQKKAAFWQLRLSLATGIPSIFAALFLGILSDRIGRRLLFIIPASGTFLRAIGYAVISHWHLPLSYLFIPHIIESSTGYFATALLGSFAYTADVTDRGKKRTLQITIMESSMGIAMGFVNIALGFMIKDWGFTIPNFFVMMCCGASTGIAIFLLPNIKSSASRVSMSIPRSLYRVFHFYFSKENGNPRGCFIICILIFMFASLPYLGSGGAETLYQMNRPLCWQSVKIGYFGAIRAFGQAVATVVLVRLMQLCLPDVGIALVSSSTKTTSLLLEAFATTDVMMYMVAVSGMAGVAMISIVRSIMSKLTRKDQIGAMFASIATVEGICNLTASVAFVAIYEQTLSFYAGFVFFCMALCVFVSCLLYIALYFQLRFHGMMTQPLRETTIVNEARKPLIDSRTDT